MDKAWLQDDYHRVSLTEEILQHEDRRLLVERLSKLDEVFRTSPTQEDRLAVVTTMVHMELLFRSGYRSYDHMARVMDDLLGAYDEDASYLAVYRHTGWMFVLSTFSCIRDAINAGVHNGMRLIDVSLWMQYLYEMIDNHVLRQKMAEHNLRIKITRTDRKNKHDTDGSAELLEIIPNSVKFAIAVSIAAGEISNQRARLN